MKKQEDVTHDQKRKIAIYRLRTTNDSDEIDIKDLRQLLYEHTKGLYIAMVNTTNEYKGIPTEEMKMLTRERRKRMEF